MKRIIQTLAMTTIALLSACATAPQNSVAASSSAPQINFQQNEFIRANYQAADALSASANLRREMPKQVPILVATLVNIDSLTESSRLGRIVSEQLQARLSQHGYSVVELKLRGNLFVKQDQGELLLSREIKDITTNHKAQAVVVGTYAVANSNVFINLKIVGNDNILLGSYDYSLNLDADTKAMLINTKK
ncbi:FlgO family outer membrane protein [Methylotenera sp.]|uniref:FlgO family outer membrane protein n=2 Tax=Methylotenera sp. TaxID=2051956 RepID=UPI0027235971|nr:FlgO family outer membrane protein [Methylotenera sp.]MDO9204216.1 FlgO family outer membrane protein [Methylotenera sp.]MDP2070349.1 FlgO family outer membrane protein [Methylotenera sp.]MDP3004564.1 FlgO family outer membrane protein [Methylotenera sp.]MDZ4210735.1 FlgO family outer membrane protein [Methylotenera sp.]